MKLKPNDDRILVKPVQAEEKIGNIHIPDVAKEQPHQGEVVAVGPGKMNDEGKFLPMRVDVGDKVVYSRYAGEKYSFQDEELLILRQGDVLLFLTEE
jgi:chaperonin GroES